MPSFLDFFSINPNDTDYDVTPEEVMAQGNYGYDGLDEYGIDQPDDEAEEEPFHKPEGDDPGAGDSYQGTDPTVFDEQDGETDEETATIPDNADQSFGSSDDPETQEHPGDEAVGDDEDDTADPAEIYEGPTNTTDEDLKSDVDFPEQGQEAQEVHVREPSQPTHSDVEELTKELIEAAERPVNWTEDYDHPDRPEEIDFYDLAPGLEGISEDELDEQMSLDDAAHVSEENMFFKELENNVLVTEIDVYGITTNEFATGGARNEQFGYFMTPYPTDDMIGDAAFDNNDFDLLIPMNTFEFMDVIGSIDVETTLQEFMLIEQDEI